MGRQRHALLPLLGLASLVLNANASPSLRDLCPVTCLEAGPNPSNWTVIGEFAQLQACQRPMVLDFSVNVPVTVKQHIRVCNMFINDFANLAGSDLASSGAETETEQVIPQLAWTPAASEDEIGGRLAVQSVDHLQSYLKNVRQASKNRVMLFGTVSDTTVGVYVGANLLGSSVGNLFDSFVNNVNIYGIAESEASLIQVCEGRSGDDVFGLIAASNADFSTVHSAVGRWSNGTCVETSSYAETLKLDAAAVTVVKPEVAPTPINGTSAAYFSNSTASVRTRRQAAGECRTVTVDDGDDCGKLLTRCGGGLSATNFYKFNPASDLCSTLQVGQRVCCTAGEIPDIRPKQNADGSCFAYQIDTGDYCNKIAISHGLTTDDLKDFNKETWGWNGCEDGFWPGNWICLSKGTPPFPAPISNAVCGPQKPGTTKPNGSTSKDWAKLNPCPLNVCCNIWGQCGTTTDFCIDTNTGPPGTAKKDTYGCISNCGMNIIRSGPPAQFIKLGYFEGFNLGSRECLNMDASQIDPSFTHVHFAFGMIRANTYEIYQEDVYAEFQFQQFKKIKGQKRIISFGGWVFSAEAPNYPIFRVGVSTPENRDKLANNLVKYVVDNDLDGLDLDWEYPSAPDLPDIPPGDLEEAMNYLRLLALLRARLPKGKSLSIAAPVSYWYLKQFPIKAMSELLDYIVFMTYDLHGQWDAGNQWANPGCPTGNCLRSHINRTETMSALTMITKAGVPSNKVLVGVSSYGRSFQMADPSCTGTSCLFTGDNRNSFARKGRCTNTAGYIANAEINEIGGRVWTDSASNSMIMVDGDLWVSYMDDELKASRTQLYKNYEMGGTIDWAVDLVNFHSPPKYDTVDLGLDWPGIKKLVAQGGNRDQEACNGARDRRTGDWVNMSCEEPEAAEPSSFTPRKRWEALGCQNAWEDAINVWKKCHEGQLGYSFTQAVGEFLRVPSHSKCDDMSTQTNCGSMGCITYPLDGKPTENRYRTGACASEIWSSIAELHGMVKNYYYSLEAAGNELRAQRDDFLSTFAQMRDDDDIYDLLMAMIPIPLNIVAARFFGGAFMSKNFFAGDSGSKATMWEEATASLIDVGSSIAKNSLSEASKDRAVISFNAIYSALIKNWMGQTDELMARLFRGDKKSIDSLTKIFEHGKMLQGKAENPGPGWTSSGNHTENWNREENIQRAFYAVAIPGVWTANGPAPVVVDFGPSCEIDARDYFREEPSAYNVGWKCINGHSYILAGVRHGPQEACGPSVPGSGGVCLPTRKWTLDILKGIDTLRNDDHPWGRITVNDLIIGAVDTWKNNDKRNILDPTLAVPDSSDSTVAEEYKGDRINVRTKGLIRIPVCGAEEAKANLNKGRQHHEDWYNYPCNP